MLREYVAGLMAACVLLGCGRAETAAASPAVPERDVASLAVPEQTLEYGNARTTVRTDTADPCAAEVEWSGTGDPDVRIMVRKDAEDGIQYVYRMEEDGDTRVTFTQGSGDYEVSVLQHSMGNKFALVYSVTLEIDAGDGVGAFTGPTAMVRYDGESDLAAKAAELCGTCGTDSEKIAAVYGYVGKSVDYDYQKAKAITAGNLAGITDVPDLDDVFASGKGVCYDIAGLMTGMLRSQGVPCQLVYGYVDDMYHAWCMVMPDEDGTAGHMPLTAGEWSVLDPTFVRHGDRRAKMYVDNGMYAAVKSY